MVVIDLQNRLHQLEWLPILLVRLSVGLLFFESGKDKLFYKLEELGNYFAQLGIPFPYLNALVVSSIEFFGGICLVFGVATRIIAIPLAFIMLVAILTAQIQKVGTLGDFLYLPEVLLLVIFVWLFFSGPEKVSIDNLIARKLGIEEKKGSPNS
jgi:putative oxidoreductase